MKKLNVAVIYGGTNTEHEVSLASATSIIHNLDTKKYRILPIKISKSNRWLVATNFLSTASLQHFDTKKVKLISQSPSEIFTKFNINLVFPVLHGPYGEDGTIQGMLEMIKLPYIGCGVMASAICMDKVIQKMLCLQAGISVVSHLTFTEVEFHKSLNLILNKIKNSIGFPCFIKPSRQGSSIGITKVTVANKLVPAIKDAFGYDYKLIAEKAVPHVREIECALLGNDQVEVSTLGEVISTNDFYDFNAKYSEGKARLVIPATLPIALTQAIQKTAVDAFRLLDCTGLSRVDFLINSKTGQFYLSEINTMPGFTKYSMYPKLWQASGLSYSKLLNRLVQLALDRHHNRSSINYSYLPKSGRRNS
jgi:D-alanine-D-alanine ligase